MIIRLPKILVFFLTLGNEAITLNSWLTITYFGGEKKLILMNHEAIHRAQAKELGWKFIPVYLWEWYQAGFSYRGNRLEIEAYKFEASLGYLNKREPFSWKKNLK